MKNIKSLVPFEACKNQVMVTPPAQNKLIKSNHSPKCPKWCNNYTTCLLHKVSYTKTSFKQVPRIK